MELRLISLFQAIFLYEIFYQWHLCLYQHKSKQAIEPIRGYTTESVTHGQCDDRPTVTFPAIEHHRPLTGTNIYYLVNRGTCM